MMRSSTGRSNQSWYIDGWGCTMRCFWALFAFTPLASAQFIHVSPQIVILSDRVGSLGISSGNVRLKFKYAGITSDFNSPNFLIVIPSSGITPAAVQIGMNPSVVAQMKPGITYSLRVNFSTVDQNPPMTDSTEVRLRVPAEPVPGIQSVLNSASLQPGLSPGALVTILGSHLTGPTLTTDYDATASYPTSVANTSVTFNGIAAPLRYVSPNQINAIVPFALAGQPSAQVVVQRFDMVSAAFTVPLQDTSPGIFTATQTGAGQGAILQLGSGNQFTYNSSSNPAAPGTILEIFATGMGVWTPPPQSDVFLFGENFTTQPVSLTIGGQPAKILYAGTMGGQSSWSMLQINAVVPDGVASGPQPVVLKIGSNDNSQQPITVAIR